MGTYELNKRLDKLERVFREKKAHEENTKDIKPVKTYGTAPLVVDFKGVMQLFSCGRSTAEYYAKKSGAEYRVGSKRYYIVSRIMEYVNTLAEDNCQENEE